MHGRWEPSQNHKWAHSSSNLMKKINNTRLILPQHYSIGMCIVLWSVQLSSLEANNNIFLSLHFLSWFSKPLCISEYKNSTSTGGSGAAYLWPYLTTQWDARKAAGKAKALFLLHLTLLNTQPLPFSPLSCLHPLWLILQPFSSWNYISQWLYTETKRPPSFQRS